MNFSKDNLVNNHYTWPTENNRNVFIGTPSRRLFNRYDGEQVLFIINSYGELSDQFTVEDGRKIEEMIQKELPLQSKSELSVLHWLKDVLQ
ncbi:MAG: hypothetical protein ACHQFX_02190 [Chitinophagales bacterium]